MKLSKVTTIAGALCLGPLSAAAAFQCPAAPSTKIGDRPPLTADDVAGPMGTVTSKLTSTVRRLRSDGFKNGDIVDVLVESDCHRLDAEANVSDSDKAQQVKRFALKIANFVYNSPGRNEEDVVLDVPITTAVYERVRQAAIKAGVSEDAWVKKAITARLGKP